MTPSQLDRVAALQAQDGLTKRQAWDRVSQEIEEEQAQRRASIAAFTDSDLAVCQSCPEYELFGMQQRCWQGIPRVDTEDKTACYRPALEQWVGRALGEREPCERIVAARYAP
jgi:chaperone required for assembly of F1-ATPase